MLTKQNARAYAVLAMIFTKLTESDISRLNIEPYLNGRESGFALCVLLPPDGWPKNMKVVFSEFRRSDSIVIYHGETHHFSMLGNGLSEHIYNRAEFLDFDQINKAADRIVGLLTNTDTDRSVYPAIREEV